MFHEVTHAAYGSQPRVGSVTRRDRDGDVEP